MQQPNFKQLFINLAASMGNEDNSSDFAGSAFAFLEQADIVVPEGVDDLDSLKQFLGKEHGAMSAWGSSTYDEDYAIDDEEDPDDQ